jgi:hypothetical protein
MNALPLLSTLLCGLLLVGYNPPIASRSYVGIVTDDTDWPYRYNLTRTNGVWSGSIDYRGTNGWVFWDTMEITRQDERDIRFRARVGERADLRLGWYLSLGTRTPQGFSAVLTGDMFDSRAIRLWFQPVTAEPGGAAGSARHDSNAD